MSGALCAQGNASDASFLDAFFFIISPFSAKVKRFEAFARKCPRGNRKTRVKSRNFVVHFDEKNLMSLLQFFAKAVTCYGFFAPIRRANGFPEKVNAPSAKYESPYGTAQKKNNGQRSARTRWFFLKSRKMLLPQHSQKDF